MRLKFLIITFFGIQFCLKVNSQVINYINNGSFEEVVTNTATPYFPAPKYWEAADSSKFFGEVLSSTLVPANVPLSGYTYQWPRTGNTHIISLQYCTYCFNNNRGYPRNRLKQTLKPNAAYCFSMYVNLSGQSTHGIDALGAYFGDSSIDTISQCNKPITYLLPQVQNPVNNIITDTLNWVLIQGSFIANGTEKYAMIGNFKSNANTNGTLVNPTNLPVNAADYLIDDVSLIELELPAFAGNDTVVMLGDSLFLGREPDVGINDACVWYKFPDANPIDTIAGFWIKPTETCTYVVRQEICGLVKWDTVRVYIDALGLRDQKAQSSRLKVYPVPATDQIEVNTDAAFLLRDFRRMRVVNQLGTKVREKEINWDGGKIFVSTAELPDGVYVIELENEKAEVLRKKFVIAR